MRKVIILIVVLLVIAVGGFGWYYFNGPCGVNKVKHASEELQAKITEFSDGVSVAESTARISLSGPVGDLQKIQRDTSDVQVPSCMEDAKKLLTGGMRTSIDGFIAFMGQESDTTVTGYFTDAQQQISVARDEIEKVGTCAPFCKADPYKRVP